MIRRCSTSWRRAAARRSKAIRVASLRSLLFLIILVVFTHGEGDYFGELAFLNKAKRECQVKAKTDTVLLTLNEYSFTIDLE